MRKALGAIFGLKLLPVSGDMVKTAKNMLDTEMEYIEYLRKRKKFFFMTQVQQTRVVIVPKKARKKSSSSGGGIIGGGGRRPKQPVKVPVRVPARKTALELMEQRSKIAGKKTGRFVGKKTNDAANKITKFMRKKKPSVPKKVPVTAKSPLVKAQPKSRVFSWQKAGGTSTLTKPKVPAMGKNKIVPFTRNLTKTAKKETVEALTKKATQKAVQKKVSQTAAKKIVGKTLLKSGAKKVPILGAVMGGIFGLGRLMKGDVKGALLEVASGVASTIPGAGTAVSIGIDGALMAKDIAEANKQPEDPCSGNVKLQDGGEVSSPTQALIAEGGEPELVVPHSKLGPVFQNLLKQVGTILTDVTTGFLTTLPVPSSSAQAVLGEATKLQAVFGANAAPVSVFKGSKISKVGGFLKKAARGLWKASPMGMVAGAAMSMFGGSPAPAQTMTITSSSSSSFRNNELVSSSEETVISGGETSASQIGGFPITDFYGPSDWRPRPHGGVDVGTPVGTPVAFAVPGEIVAAGKYGGYGNMMDVWLPSQKIQMRIAHLSKFVKKTGEFMAGEPVAETGGAKGDPGAGSSTGPHLHFEFDTKKDSTRYGGAGDPLPYASMLQLGSVQPPSGEGKGGPSYGAPLSQTVKWPTSGGSMGGPSLMPVMASGIRGVLERFNIIPQPVVVPQLIPFPVTKVVKEKVTQHKSYGIDPFSGKYVEL